MKKTLKEISKILLDFKTVEVNCDKDGIEWNTSLKIFKDGRGKEDTINFASKGNRYYIRIADEDYCGRYEFKKLDIDQIQTILEEYFIIDNNINEIIDFVVKEGVKK